VITVLRADARSLPLPDESVDLICTSPPYWGLRDYRDGDASLAGQIGTGTLDQYLQDLWEVTAEMARVLKPVGSIFVELGDSYTDKSLNDAPFRYAIGCRDKLGLIRRATIVWHHMNGLPESVTDRVRSAHSYVFHFTKQPRYYSAVDEVREEHHRGPNTHAQGRGGSPNATYASSHGNRMESGQGVSHRTFDKESTYLNPLGKLPGSVWEIPSQPLTVPARLGTDHFAAFPMELPRRVIAGWSPPGICTACGEGRRPVVDKALVGVWHDKPPQQSHYTGNEVLHRNGRKREGDPMMRTFGSTSATITGYACACPQPGAPTRPSLVIDPFGGTGTTALVADALGRHGISFDRSADYCRLAQWRTTDPAERAKALQVPKPPPVMDGQGALFA
jgi:DNA modification methylase